MTKCQDNNVLYDTCRNCTRQWEYFLMSLILFESMLAECTKEVTDSKSSHLKIHNIRPNKNKKLPTMRVVTFTSH